MTNERSSISLDLDHADPIFGQPVACLDWQLLEEDKHTATRALEICDTYPCHMAQSILDWSLI